MGKWCYTCTVAVFPEMTLLSSQPKPLDSTATLDSTPAAGTGTEVRQLEKRSKVIEELLQTEKDYIKDLQMCVVEIIEPLQKKQVGISEHTVLSKNNMTYRAFSYLFYLI